MVKLKDISKHERISELLRQLGHDTITLEQFWAQMRQYGLTDVDIDKFCCGERIK